MRAMARRWLSLPILAICSAPTVALADPVRMTSGSLSANSILDQQYVPIAPFEITSAVDDVVDKAQTFTVGVRGLLTEVDVLIETVGSGGSKLFVDVLPTINGVPVNDDDLRLARVSLSRDAPTPVAFVGFDVRSFGIMVEPGDMLAIAMHMTMDVIGSIATLWNGQDVNGYDRGEHFVRFPAGLFGNPTTWTNSGVFFVDTGFKTFVEPSASATPEPCTLLLIGTAPAWLWLRGRRNHARAN